MRSLPSPIHQKRASARPSAAQTALRVIPQMGKRPEEVIVVGGRRRVCNFHPPEHVRFTAGVDSQSLRRFCALAWGSEELESSLAGMVAPRSACNSPDIRATKSGGVFPPGMRVHCTSCNLSGTDASRSRVSSMTTGIRNGFLSDMWCVRSTASFHSCRK